MAENNQSEMIRCAYCRTERPISEMKQGTIIARGRKWDAWKKKNVACVVKETNWYCNDKPCHGHDQMAHEG